MRSLAIYGLFVWLEIEHPTLIIQFLSSENHTAIVIYNFFVYDLAAFLIFSSLKSKDFIINSILFIINSK